MGMRLGLQKGAFLTAKGSSSGCLGLRDAWDSGA